MGTILPTLCSTAWAIVSLQVAVAEAGIEWFDDSIIGKTREATVIISSGEVSAVAGFFASDDGLVVTSATTLEGLDAVILSTSDGAKITGARIVALNPRTDLAVLSTGTKPTAFLSVREKPTAAGSPCALVFHSNGRLRSADGVILARRETLDATATRFVEVWSIAVKPNINGLTGAPVVTRDGRVVAMCNLVTGRPPQKFVFGCPESAIAAVLNDARSATGPVVFPKVGDITVHGEPSHDPDYMNGMRRMSAGDAVGALASFQSALQRYPANPAVILQVAANMERTGDTAGAEELLEKAVRLAPEHLQIRLSLGLLRSRKAATEKTVRYFQDLTKEHPKLGVAWGEMGGNLFDLGRRDEALTALRKHTELEPDDIGAWSTYATALFATGDYEASSRARKRAEELESFFFKLSYLAPKRKQ